MITGMHRSVRIILEDDPNKKSKVMYVCEDCANTKYIDYPAAVNVLTAIYKYCKECGKDLPRA